MKIKFLFFFCLLFTFTNAYAEDTYPFTSANDTQRFQTLTNEIRCVVCQNQTIAESNAPLATDLRAKVYRMVIGKKSDDEIKTYLVKRYGEFILLQPRFNKSTAILWIFPFIAITCILFFFIRFMGSKKTECEC